MTEWTYLLLGAALGISISTLVILAFDFVSARKDKKKKKEDKE